jgi:hypothetical protein
MKTLDVVGRTLVVAPCCHEDLVPSIALQFSPNDRAALREYLAFYQPL